MRVIVKKLRMNFCWILCIGVLSLNGKRTIIDEISAIVYCDGPHIIISSESTKPDLNGSPRTLEDAVKDELMLCDAKKLHITVTADDVNRYMGELQKNNHMTRAGMERAMEEIGYTYQEGLERLRRRQTIEQLLDSRVRGDVRFIVTREDVMAFDALNPVWETATYTLMETIVDDPCAGETQFTQKQLDLFSWEEPFDVKESQLAEDKKFIVNAQEGEIVFRERLGENQFELTRLARKRPRRKIGLDDIVDPVNKRSLYDVIVDRIRSERYGQLIEGYHKELCNNASIRFTHGYDRENFFNITPL